MVVTGAASPRALRIVARFLNGGSGVHKVTARLNRAERNGGQTLT